MLEDFCVIQNLNFDRESKSLNFVQSKILPLLLCSIADLLRNKNKLYKCFSRILLSKQVPKIHFQHVATSRVNHMKIKKDNLHQRLKEGEKSYLKNLIIQKTCNKFIHLTLLTSYFYNLTIEIFVIFPNCT